MASNLQGAIHRRVALNRRLEVLSRELAKMIPEGASVLDVGSGNGEIAKRIMAQKPGIRIDGIDVVVRKDSAIPVSFYDGITIPRDGGSYDYVMCIDMLHHSDNPAAMLGEAKRVASKGVILKDHNCDSWLARKIISFTDWFANAQYGVPMTYNYYSRSGWREMWQQLDLESHDYTDSFGLYPFYSYLIFARDQDFICVLRERDSNDCNSICLTQKTSTA